jgi:2-C-methyl-D-erythritol 4-phosphate cytidylyltransferase
MGLGYSKAYVELTGRPMLTRTIESLLASPFIDRVTCAVRPDETGLCRKEVVEKYGLGEKVDVMAGGEQRQHTVLKLLESSSPERDLVLIHDGARPLVSPHLIEQVLTAASNWGAAIAALPVTDTVKTTDDGGETVSGTLDRARIYRVQTPQAFHRDVIMAAHRRALKEGWEATDDASMVERMGEPVRMVAGEERNIKVTTLENLEYVRWILESSEM